MPLLQKKTQNFHPKKYKETAEISCTDNNAFLRYRNLDIQAYCAGSFLLITIPLYALLYYASYRKATWKNGNCRAIGDFPVKKTDFEINTVTQN